MFQQISFVYIIVLISLCNIILVTIAFLFMILIKTRHCIDKNVCDANIDQLVGLLAYNENNDYLVWRKLL